MDIFKIFVKDRSFCRLLYYNLKNEAQSISLLHGQINAKERHQSIYNFKSGESLFLIESINTVINYNIPGKQGSYMHRVGRTGRSGTAITLMTNRDLELADKLLHHFLLTGIDHQEALVSFVEKSIQNNNSLEL